MPGKVSRLKGEPQKKRKNKQQKYQENEYENVDTRNVSYGVNGDSSYAF